MTQARFELTSQQQAMRRPGESMTRMTASLFGSFGAGTTNILLFSSPSPLPRVAGQEHLFLSLGTATAGSPVVRILNQDSLEIGPSRVRGAEAPSSQNKLEEGGQGYGGAADCTFNLGRKPFPSFPVIPSVRSS